MNPKSTLFLFMLFFISSCVNKTTFYVSPNGDDLQNGTSIECPFATLQRARDAIREIKTEGDLKSLITVYMLEGTYQIHKPFVLNSEDSGTDKYPIIYRSYKDDKVIISGGKKVCNWTKTELNGHNVLVADVSELNGKYTPFEQLWVNGHRAIQARTPNKGYLKVASIYGEDTKKIKRKISNSFLYSSSDEHYFKGVDDGVAVVFNKWLEYHMPIDRIDHQNKMIISTKKGRRAIEGDDDYYLEGGRVMLDNPGEWYLDRKSDKLYYFPLSNETEVVATIPLLVNVLRMEGDAVNNKYVENVQFKKLTFSNTTWKLSRDSSEPSGYAQADVLMEGSLHLQGVKNCLFEECEITSIGNYGIEIGLGCSDNKVLHCEIHDLGAGGLLIGSKIRPSSKRDYDVNDNNFPPVLKDPSDATCNNEIADCKIYDGGRYFHCAVGIWIGQSPDNKICHNEIYNFYYSGISSGWTWGYGNALATGNIFEYNHVHHIGRLQNGDGPVLSDLGGIYTLGNQTGTIIRNNVFNDIWAGKYGGWGIYCDEGSSNILIENNLVYKCRQACFNQHYGKDNIVRNNIFAFADASIVMMGRCQPHTSFILSHNIFLSDGTPVYAGGYEYDVNKKGVFKSDSNLVWSTIGDVIGAQNKFPSHLYEADKPVINWEKWKELGYDNHSLIADPGFKDPINCDFSLPENSPALKIGFKPFSIDQVGIR